MTMRMEQWTRFEPETNKIKGGGGGGGEERDGVVVGGGDNKNKVLHKVDLSGLCLDSLPCSSLNLAFITRLDLSNNNLETIPESLTARLLNLVSLDVHSNQLISLPNSIGCLSKLKTLNVSGNLLDSIPRTIEDCKSLEELILNFNKLTKLPDTIGFELVNLKILSVNSNKLTFLPYSTSHLTNLRYLDARLNCLQSLPDGLENLIRLQTLNVSQNFQHLTSIPASVGLLLSLTDLDISYNSITVLPDSLGCLIKLQSLHAEGNSLVCPPMEVIEQSIDAMRTFLCERMKESPTDHDRRRKGSWIGRLVKFPTFSVGTPNVAALKAERGDFLLSDYRSIDGHATPRNLGMFSPRRLFSPRRSKTGK